MIYRDFGKTGLKVSSLGYGANYPPTKDEQVLDMPHPSTVNEKKQIELFLKAAGSGVNYFDTCEFYRKGQSEEILGKAIKKIGRKKVILSTKIPVDPAMGGCGDSGRVWTKKLHGQLKRIKTGYIDVHHFHDLRWEEYTKFLDGRKGPLHAAQKARKDGHIRHISFSTHDHPCNISKLIRTGEFESMLVYHNLLYRLNETVIKEAHQKGLGVAVMGPTVGGRLLFKPGLDIKNKQKRARHVFRFVFADPNIDIILSGMNTSNIIDENVAFSAQRQPLSPKEKKIIENIYNEVKGLKEIYCIGCGYCLPCPKGVDIPSAFFLMNILKIFPHQKQWSIGQFEKIRQRKASPDQCIACGQCVKKCPQELQIPEHLAEIGTEFTMLTKNEHG